MWPQWQQEGLSIEGQPPAFQSGRDLYDKVQIELVWEGPDQGEGVPMWHVTEQWHHRQRSHGDPSSHKQTTDTTENITSIQDYWLNWKMIRTHYHPAGTSIVSDICDLSNISDIAPLTLGSMEKSFFYHLFCVTQETYLSKDLGEIYIEKFVKVWRSELCWDI